MPVHKLKLFNAVFLANLFFLYPPTITAEQRVEFGEYKIHYTVISSLLIPEAIAGHHQIVRSKNRIVTNISVRRGDASVEAEVSGRVTNLLSQIFDLEFIQVKEEHAWYYLASLLLSERDSLIFEINIRPKDEKEGFPLKFERHYYSGKQ